MVTPKRYILVPLQILLAAKGIDKFIQWSQQIIIQRDLETLYSCMILIIKPTIRYNKLICLSEIQWDLQAWPLLKWKYDIQQIIIVSSALQRIISSHTQKK